MVTETCRTAISGHTQFLPPTANQSYFFANASEGPYSSERSGASVKMARENGERRYEKHSRFLASHARRARDSRSSHSRITLTVLGAFRNDQKHTRGSRLRAFLNDRKRLFSSLNCDWKWAHQAPQWFVHSRFTMSLTSLAHAQNICGIWHSWGTPHICTSEPTDPETTCNTVEPPISNHPKCKA